MSTKIKQKTLKEVSRLNPNRKPAELQDLTLSQMIAEIAVIHNDKEGCTYDILAGIAPNKGYAVGVYGYEKRFSGKKITFDHVASYLKDHIYTILSNGYALGTWYDGETGFTYFDCVALFSNKWDAMEFGKYNAQKSIYDLSANRELKIV